MFAVVLGFLRTGDGHTNLQGATFARADWHSNGVVPCDTAWKLQPQQQVLNHVDSTLHVVSNTFEAWLSSALQYRYPVGSSLYPMVWVRHTCNRASDSSTDWVTRAAVKSNVRSGSGKYRPTLVLR